MRAAALLLALAAVLPPALPRAQEPAPVIAPGAPAADPSGRRRAFLDVTVNSGETVPALCVLEAADVWVPVDELAAAGLARFAGRRIPDGERTVVSLSSLAPAVRYELDEKALAVRITAGAELLATARIDFARAAPEGYRLSETPSAFLNYAAGVHSGAAHPTLSLDGGGNVGGTLLGVDGFTRPDDGRPVRGMTTVTYEDPEQLFRLTLGDAYAAGGTLGGGVLLGGLTIAREFSLNPYLQRAPLPSMGGVSLTPGLLDVYVNGVLVREQRVAAGAWDLQNLPVPTGSGSVRTVLRDAYGRSQELDLKTYFGTGILAPGLTDWAAQLGFRRKAYGTESFDYGPPVLVARHRAGLTDWFTAGFRLEGGPYLASGGPEAAFVLPAGELGLALAASRDGARSGASGALTYSYLLRAMSFGARVAATTRAFASATTAATDDRALLDARAFVAAPLFWKLTASGDVSGTIRRDTGSGTALSASLNAPIGRGAAAFLTVSRSFTPDRAAVDTASLSFSWSLGAETAQASVSRSSSTTSGGVGLDRALGPGPGYGYRLRADSGAGSTGSAVVQAQGANGRLEVGASRDPAGNASYAEAAGAIVALEGRTFFTRPVQQGYGLIQVPGVEGVRGYAENQEVGRTDRHGDLFVPSLVPYYASRLSISDSDVPLDRNVDTTSTLVAPRTRGGAVARFVASVLRAITGRFAVAGAATTPAFGEVSLVTARGARVTSPVGRDGRFWLDGLSPGEYRAEVVWPKGRCTATLVVPDAGGIADAGTVTCSPMPRHSEGPGEDPRDGEHADASDPDPGPALGQLPGPPTAALTR